MYVAGIYAREKINDCMRSRGWQLKRLPDRSSIGAFSNNYDPDPEFTRL